MLKIFIVTPRPTSRYIEEIHRYLGGLIRESTPTVARQSVGRARCVCVWLYGVVGLVLRHKNSHHA